MTEIAFHAYMHAKKTWASKTRPALGTSPVAYFSAEFGLHESLRIYSGGLGHPRRGPREVGKRSRPPVRRASASSTPGIFPAADSADGWQQELYPAYDPAKLPLTPVKDRKGNPIVRSASRSAVPQSSSRPGVLQVGRVPLYLLDTNLPQNERAVPLI